MDGSGGQESYRNLDDDPCAVERGACGVGVVAAINGRKSHRIVQQGLSVLKNLSHRGATGWDPLTSDGAGILTQIPHSFLAARVPNLPKPGTYAVAMVFWPRDADLEPRGRVLFKATMARLGLGVLHERQVPVDSALLGPLARESEPHVEQIIFTIDRSVKASERLKLCVRGRLLWEHELVKTFGSAVARRFHIASLSNETLVYKALTLAAGLPAYYPDLRQRDFKSAFCVCHQRFSTNTLPSWPLAQPFGFIAHNGEINTLRGNVNRMIARQAIFSRNCAEFGPDGAAFPPAGSDSAILDRMVAWLKLSGRSLTQAMSMLIPEPFEHAPGMSEALRDYYEYQSYLMEPWDGPALVAFAGEECVGAILDRNGLRPGRYWLTHDEHLILASEAGVLPVPAEDVRAKGILEPGRMLVVDLKEQAVLVDGLIKRRLAHQKPYGQWLREHRIKVVARGSGTLAAPHQDPATIKRVFAYKSEEEQLILAPMVKYGKEPVGSMGNDMPLAVLSQKSQRLMAYFKQAFAQVTNPPIDALREAQVTSLSTHLGAEGDLFREEPEQCRFLSLARPVIDAEEFRAILERQEPWFRHSPLDLTLALDETHGLGLETRLDDLARAAAALVRDGVTILVLSDEGYGAHRVPIPALLGLGAIHQHLIHVGLRAQASIVLASGEPREVHDFALALGYGADAVFPYGVLAVASALPGDYSRTEDRRAKVLRAVGDGLLKVMSKMGVTTLRSYQGAQMFEALGLGPQVIRTAFTGTPSRIGGLGFQEIASEMRSNHAAAYDPDPQAESESGIYAWRVEGEDHLHSPEMISGLQQAVTINSREEFTRYVAGVEGQAERTLFLRSLLELKFSEKPLPLDAVEPAAKIVRRIATGAMSFGSISQAAHETLALAMNRIGARSNSGEGGEDPRRYQKASDGSSRRSAIKQVASGRFGVTTEYLVNADELQIKIAQGAKPGEGGQLPGDKVTGDIARVRHTSPGVTLISPPPHHDIYSIEDLAQLIHDLRSVNPKARISVKLVAAHGVGTIAAGVAKAKADAILISGGEGGTGASPLSSIRHAGIPWELGLVEAHEALVSNRLRHRVVLQTDGGLRTPRDLVLATILGAEEWGIGTGALIALGCIMMRKCHLNTCPVGIATQDPVLTERFRGQPEHVINYAFLLAEEMRLLMAQLGVPTIDALVGRTDLIGPRPGARHSKAATLNLDFILRPGQAPLAEYQHERLPHDLSHNFDERVLLEATRPALERGKEVSIVADIRNTATSVGSRLSGEIARRYGATGLRPGTIRLRLRGSAGQSFMAFGACGIEAIVEGEVNDYCGKGLSGAIVVVQSPQNRGFKAETAVVCGNVALYGATSGQLFVQGRAGERFAVRNSGAEAVVEAVGNHACEYMTGGVVLVLGTTGTNFAAGMTGGVAYVLDWEGDFSRKANLAYVSLDPIGVRDFDAVLRLLKDHAHYTGSLTADFLLRHFDSHRGKIIRVCPIDAGAQTVPGPRVTLKARPDRRLIARTVRGLLREELNG